MEKLKNDAMFLLLTAACRQVKEKNVEKKGVLEYSYEGKMNEYSKRQGMIIRVIKKAPCD